MDSLDTEIKKKILFFLTELLYLRGKITGFLSLWQNPLHTQSLYLQITVRPSAQYEKEFNILYKKALKYKNLFKLRFQTLYPSTDTCVDFLKNSGFKEVMQTFDFSTPITFKGPNLPTNQKYKLITVDKISIVY